jgi:hypothetical protein
VARLGRKTLDKVSHMVWRHQQASVEVHARSGETTRPSEKDHQVGHFFGAHQLTDRHFGLVFAKVSCSQR